MSFPEHTEKKYNFLKEVIKPMNNGQLKLNDVMSTFAWPKDIFEDIMTSKEKIILQERNHHDQYEQLKEAYDLFSKTNHIGFEQVKTEKWKGKVDFYKNRSSAFKSLADNDYDTLLKNIEDLIKTAKDLKINDKHLVSLKNDVQKKQN